MSLCDSQYKLSSVAIWYGFPELPSPEEGGVAVCENVNENQTALSTESSCVLRRANANELNGSSYGWFPVSRK